MHPVKGSLTPQGERTRLAILRFVADFVGQRGYAPTIPEIAQGVGRAQSAIFRQLGELEKAGRLRRDRGAACTIRLLLAPGIVTVPMAWCEPCDSEMPADHARHLTGRATPKTPTPGSENP